MATPGHTAPAGEARGVGGRGSCRVVDVGVGHGCLWEAKAAAMQAATPGCAAPAGWPGTVKVATGVYVVLAGTGFREDVEADASAHHGAARKSTRRKLRPRGA